MCLSIEKYLFSNVGLNPFMDDVHYGNISHYVVVWVCENSQFRAKKTIQLFIHLIYCRTWRYTHNKCLRVNTVGFINKEHTNFETTLSFHHYSVVHVRISIYQKSLLVLYGRQLDMCLAKQSWFNINNNTHSKNEILQG